MPSVPLELKALVVHELANDQKALSAISLVWPETIPYIREHRFKNLQVLGSDQLSRFLQVIGGAPTALSTIRSINITMSIFTGTMLPTMDEYTNLMTFIMRAPNLEELIMQSADLSQFNIILAGISSSPHAPINVRTLDLQSSHTCTLTVLLNILHSFPHLTTLTLALVAIEDLSRLASHVWNLNTHFRPDHCVIWDPQGFEAPEEVPQITSLCIHFSSPSDLMLLDLLASPKTPFPNLEEITLVDDFLPMCRPRRLPALLERYRNTLRVLDLLGDGPLRCETPVLALPPTLEHFKFTVNYTKLLGNFCETLSSSGSLLREVTINFQCAMVYSGYPLPDTTALDTSIAAMPGLEQLHLKVRPHMKKSVEEGFRRCHERQAEGRLKIVWHVWEI